MPTSSPTPFALAALFALAACGSTPPSLDVHVSGNRAVSQAELHAMIGDPPVDRGGRDAWVERSLLLLSAGYYDRGYLEVRVDLERIERDADETPRSVFVGIAEGQRFRLAAVRTLERDEQGAAVEPLGGTAALRGMVGLREGDWFDQSVMARGVTAIRSLYRNEGFARVVVEPETHLDAPNATVEVVIPVVRGPRVTVDRVEVVGADDLPTPEVRPGDRFSELAIEGSLARLRALPSIERVDAVVEPVGADRALVQYVVQRAQVR